MYAAGSAILTDNIQKASSTKTDKRTDSGFSLDRQVYFGPGKDIFRHTQGRSQLAEFVLDLLYIIRSHAEKVFLGLAQVLQPRISDGIGYHLSFQEHISSDHGDFEQLHYGPEQRFIKILIRIA